MAATQYVRWTGQDDQGKFSHVGPISQTADEQISFTNEQGYDMTVPMSECRIINKPKGWKITRPEAQPVVLSEKKPTVARAPRSGGPTKKQRALDIYKGMMDNNTHPARDDVIVRFCNELEMTPAGASTYQSMAKKANS